MSLVLWLGCCVANFVGVSGMLVVALGPDIAHNRSHRYTNRRFMSSYIGPPFAVETTGACSLVEDRAEGTRPSFEAGRSRKTRVGGAFATYFF